MPAPRRASSRSAYVAELVLHMLVQPGGTVKADAGIGAREKRDGLKYQ